LWLKRYRVEKTIPIPTEVEQSIGFWGRGVASDTRALDVPMGSSSLPWNLNIGFLGVDEDASVDTTMAFYGYVFEVYSDEACTTLVGTLPESWADSTLHVEAAILARSATATGVSGGGVLLAETRLRSIPRAAGQIQFHVEIPVPDEVVLTVYGIGGNRVREIHHGRLSVGGHRFTWDGTNARGHRVGPGVYFARLETSWGEVSTKAIVTR
jgi:hypothetical protein